MKWIAAITATILIALGAGGIYIVSKNKAKARCSQWVLQAEQSIEQGYYAAGIETLTLYFSTEKCRGLSDDTPALNLLTEARPNVPLPDRAHLAQSLMLARLGLRLESDNRDHLQLASAALSAGDWSQAYHHGSRAEGPRASLIMLAAATALEDDAATKTTLTRLQNEAASPFQRAFAHQILSARKVAPTTIDPLVIGLDNRYLQLARFVVNPQQAPLALQELAATAPRLEDEDLAVASMLLIAKQQTEAALTLLDQPVRAMPPALLSRLSRLLWLKDKQALSADPFLLRAVDGSMPGEAFLMVCLTEWQASGQCRYRFDEMEHKQRYGIFSASRWMKLLKALKDGPSGAVQAIDAMNDMPELLANVPIALPLKSVLLSVAAEEALARKYQQSATAMGYSFDIALGQQTPTDAPGCAQDDQACLASYIDTDQQDLTRWRTAIEQGFTPSLDQATILSEQSPDEAIMWRRALALSLVKTGGDANHARALKIVREGIALSPTDALLQLIAASSYSRFGDNSAAFTALVDAVKANPDYAAMAMRLALGFHQNSTDVDASDLVHQWVALSRVEMRQRGASQEMDKLVLERLSLLAAFGQDKADDALAKASYEAILKIDGKSHIALNNLAYILFQEKGDLRRARAMAIKAVTLAPGVGEYRDTLRDVESALKKKARGEA